MSPLAILAIQISASFMTFGLLASWVVAPALAGKAPVRALPPLLWVHAFRYVPLALYAPGQVASDIPSAAIDTVAWGDFGAAVLALVALVALRVAPRAGMAATWGFSIASAGDIVVALVVALRSGVHEHALGVGWFVLVLYVPAVCVSQVMIFGQLRRPIRSSR